MYSYITRRFKAKVSKRWPKMKTLGVMNEAAKTLSYKNVVDIWCPDPANYGRDKAFHDSRQHRWWYFCMTGGLTGQEMWRSATGVRSWGMNRHGFLYWASNPWGGIYGYENGKWTVKRTNGDGGLLYPTENGKTWASIRLKHLRDGVEDYEYLRLLSQLAKNSPNAALKARAEKLLVADQPIHLLRTSVAQCIELLEASQAK